MSTLRAALITTAIALPLALGWTVYTEQPTPGNFLLGYGFSMLAVRVAGLRGESFRLRNAPRQLYNLGLYIVFMAFEVLWAGLKVSRIILSPTLNIDPDISDVGTQDESESDLISAISAHGITITPGELVVDFGERGTDGAKMIVHSLTHAASAPNLDAEQAQRLKRIKGILGHD